MRRRWVVLGLAAAGAGALFGALKLPAVDRYLAGKVAGWAGAAGWEVSIDALDFDPWGPRIAVSGVRVAAPAGWTFQADDLSVRLVALRSLTGTPHLRVRLDRPRLGGVVRVPSAGAGGRRPRGPVPRLVLDACQIRDGSVDLDVPALDLSVRLPRISSEWEKRSGTWLVDGGLVRWRGVDEVVERIRFEGEQRFGAIRVTRAEVRSRSARVSVTGTVGPWGALDLEVAGSVALTPVPSPWLGAFHLARFAPVAGRVRVAGRVGGRVDAPEVRGTVTGTGIRFGPLGPSGARFGFELDREGVRFQDLSVSGPALAGEGVSGRLGWADGVSLQVKGRCTRYDLRRFMGLFVPGWFPVGITVTGSFEAEGPLYPELALRCRVAAEGRDLDVTLAPGADPVYALDRGTLETRCTVGRNGLVLEDGVLRSGGTTVRIPLGRVVYREGLWFETEVATDGLGPARQYVPDWISARGTATGRFGGPYRSLEFRYAVDLEDVAVWGVDLGRVTARADYDLRTLRVFDGLLDGPVGRARVSGTAGLHPGGRWDLAVSAVVPDLGRVVPLARAFGVGLPEPVAGSGTADGRLVGPLTDPAFDGGAELERVALAGRPVGGLQGRGRVGRSGWVARSVRAEMWDGLVRGRGRGDWAGFRASARVDGLDLGRMIRELAGETRLAGVFGGEVVSSGSYREPAAEARGRVTGVGWDGRRFGDADVSARLDGPRVTARATAFGNAVSAAATVDLAPGFPFSVDWNATDLPVTSLPFPVPEALAGAKISGQGFVGGAIGLPLEDYRLAFQASLAGADWNGLPLGTARVRADWAGRGVGFHASAAEGRLKVDGLWSARSGWPVEATVTADGFPVVPGGGGEGPLVSGRLSGMVAAADLADGLSAGRPTDRLWAVLGAVQDLDGRLSWTPGPGPGGWRVPAGTATVSAGPAGRVSSVLQLPAASARGTVDPRTREWSVRFDLDGLRPDVLLPAGRPVAGLTGRWSGRAELEGRDRTPTDGSAELRVEGFATAVVAPGDWEAGARWTGGGMTADVRGPDGVSGTARWTPPGGAEVSVRLDGTSTGRFLRPGVLPAGMTAEVNGDAVVKIPPDGPVRGTLVLAEVTVDAPPTVLRQTRPVEARYEDGRVWLDALSLGGDGLDLSVAGSLAFGRTWDLAIDGRFGLDVLPHWVRQISRARGVARADLTVTGPWDAPLVQGSASVEAGARFELDGVALPFEDADAQARFLADGEVALDWFDAQFGPGRVHLEGNVTLDGFRPRGLLLFAELRDLAYEAPPGVFYGGDADFQLTGTVDAPELRGDVRLERFSFKRHVSLNQLIIDALRRRPQAVGDAWEQSNLFVDLSLRGDRDLRVDNNLAHADLAVDIRARGYLPSPEVWGQVRILGGTARVRSLDYELARSTLDFLGDVEQAPRIDLRARAETSGYFITVEVTGPLDDYQVLLTSVPPLQDTDILALLLLGAKSEDLAGGEGVPQSQAVGFLAVGLQDRLTGGRENFLGFDQFTIDSAYSPTTQSTSPRVVLGRPITRRTYARYSVVLGSTYEQDAEVQYDLSRRISLLGTWSDRGQEQQGSLGGELRLRFTFR